MIDFRIPIVQFIKDTLNDIDVFDGALTFKQPNDNYLTYYILNEEKASYLNNTSLAVNSSDATILDDKYTPLTIATISLDIRGVSSFLNARNLYNSLDTISNKKLLYDSGVSFMSLGAISSLPQLKNTRNEEGYLFDFTFSYDNSHIEEVQLVDIVTMKDTVSIST